MTSPNFQITISNSTIEHFSLGYAFYAMYLYFILVNISRAKQFSKTKIHPKFQLNQR